MATSDLYQQVTYVTSWPLLIADLCCQLFGVNRYRRELETCPQTKTSKSGHAIFFSFFRRVRATSMTHRRVENTRVHFWTFSPVSVCLVVISYNWQAELKSDYDPKNLFENIFHRFLEPFDLWYRKSGNRAIKFEAQSDFRFGHGQGSLNFWLGSHFHQDRVLSHASFI